MVQLRTRANVRGPGSLSQLVMISKCSGRTSVKMHLKAPCIHKYKEVYPVNFALHSPIFCSLDAYLK